MSTAGKQTWPQEIQYCSEVRRESVPTKQGNKPRRRRKKKDTGYRGYREQFKHSSVRKGIPKIIKKGDSSQAPVAQGIVLTIWEVRIMILGQKFMRFLYQPIAGNSGMCLSSPGTQEARIHSITVLGQPGKNLISTEKNTAWWCTPITPAPVGSIK
jgi:hypothetical protein